MLGCSPEYFSRITCFLSFLEHVPPGPSNVEDFPSWAASFDGSFTSRSSYSLFTNESENQDSSHWKKFWKCPICGRLEEVHLHALRDCICVKEVWLQRLPSKLAAEFFLQADVNNWVMENFALMNCLVDGMDWRLVFGVTTWCIWQERSSKVSAEKYKQPYEMVNKIKSLIVEFNSSAWDLGMRKVCFETDSRAAISIIEHGCHSYHPCYGLISEIQALKKRDWEIQIVHVYREANKVVDFLASLAVSLDYGLYVLDSPPLGCGEILIQDLIGVMFPRRVAVCSGAWPLLITKKKRDALKISTFTKYYYDKAQTLREKGFGLITFKVELCCVVLCQYFALKFRDFDGKSI
ncbi:Ribonuclease H-like superfamily [Sesbania bispinosa]|nr:Ribonuclease H-like superfamily [Sesbania bispinosa]